MSRTCKAIGITQAGQPLGPVTITRRALAEDDILMKIQYCGICHSG
jgi:alcohol dehydrogenase (NADP+)